MTTERCPRCRSELRAERDFVQYDNDCRSWGQCIHPWHDVSAPEEKIDESAREHSRSCSAGYDFDSQCTCGLDWRIKLRTEQEMHAAWRKRAEESESRVAALEKRIAELEDALSRLRAEAAGIVCLARPELVAIVSVTNVRCLENAIEKADQALASLREGK